MKMRGISKAGFQRITASQHCAQGGAPDDPRYPGFSDEFYQALDLISVDDLRSEEEGHWSNAQLKLADVVAAEAARQSGDDLWASSMEMYMEAGIEFLEEEAQKANLSLMDHLTKELSYEIYRGDREVIQGVLEVAVEYLEGPLGGSVYDSQIFEEFDHDYALGELMEWAEEPETQQRIWDFLANTGKIPS